MKKFLVIVLAFVLFCSESLFAFSGANAESASTQAAPQADITIAAREDGTGEIQRIELETADYTVPSEVSGWKVTAIGSSAFYKCESLVTLTLPDTVTTIDYGAFSNCYNLETVNLPDSLTTIGDFAFHTCSSLQTLNIPNSVTSIGHGAFTGCNRLTDIRISPDHPVYAFGNNGLIDKKNYTYMSYIGPDVAEYEVPRGIKKIGDDAFTFRELESIVVPEGVTAIGDRAFCFMYNLEKVTLPDSVTSIGYKAFYSAQDLESIRIPAAVTEIAGGNFAWCKTLKTIDVDPANPVFEMQDNMLINKKEHKIVFHMNKDTGTFEVPEGIEIIGVCAFENSDQLETIILPDTVKEIGEDAFACCSSLTTLRLPKDLKTIERGMIRDSNSIKTITLPEGVETIKSLAINFCENLEEIIIPSTVTDIGINAFANCPKLVCKVPEGSKAQQYCEEYNIKYVIQ
ncbi:MAG: leucine-rich repeat domain-containing protein [Clostridia bacterium]|nr:leucine-rich repeat domain-containing protein [Clostridia bacterium]